MASYLPQVKTKVNMIKSIGDNNAVPWTCEYTYEQGHDEIDPLIKEVR